MRPERKAERRLGAFGNERSPFEPGVGERPAIRVVGQAPVNDGRRLAVVVSGDRLIGPRICDRDVGRWRAGPQHEVAEARRYAAHDLRFQVDRGGDVDPPHSGLVVEDRQSGVGRHLLCVEGEADLHGAGE